jgi:hypothetical protein
MQSIVFLLTENLELRNNHTVKNGKPKGISRTIKLIG